nr:MAG TPA_asm: hypothetical protein [Caudoviricetes sp.]
MRIRRFTIRRNGERACRTGQQGEGPSNCQYHTCQKHCDN